MINWLTIVINLFSLFDMAVADNYEINVWQYLQDWISTMSKTLFYSNNTTVVTTELPGQERSVRRWAIVTYWHFDTLKV